MVVDSGAEERQLFAAVDVTGGELLEVARELLFGERRPDVELAPEADAFGDVAEELLHRGDSDRREHLLAVPLGQ